MEEAVKTLALCLLAFLGSVVLIHILRPLATRLGLVDVPDHRKTHQAAVPLVGGVAIWIGLAIAFLITQLVLHQQLNGASGYFAGASILVGVGVLDDLFELTAWTRLVVQAGVALVAVYVGHALLIDLGDIWGMGAVYTGILAVPFSVFCIVGVINAFNMLDGVTGLAGGVALAALSWFLMFAHFTGRADLSAAILLFASVLAGFLACNLRNPWRRELTFLGDAGSMLLGFTLAWCAIHTSQAPTDALTPAAALWILGLPLLETVSLMLRRIMRGRSPIQAGRDHLHHLLLAYGWSEQATVLAEVTFALTLGGVGYFGWHYHVRSLDLSAGFVVFGVCYLIAVDIAWRLLAQPSREPENNDPV